MIILKRKYRKIVDSLMKGLDTKEISLDCGKPINTINFYISALERELDVTNRVALVLMLEREGYQYAEN
jgi:DNA-binding NarL/FixJ family response regulator